MNIVHRRRKRNPALSQADVQMIQRREAKIIRLLAKLPDDYRREIKIRAVREDMDRIVRTAEELYATGRAREVARIRVKQSRPLMQDRRTREYKACVAAGNPNPSRDEVIEFVRARAHADALALMPETR